MNRSRWIYLSACFWLFVFADSEMPKGIEQGVIIHSIYSYSISIYSPYYTTAEINSLKDNNNKNKMD